MKTLKLAAVIVLYYPSVDNLKKVNKILDVVDKIYVVDNTDDYIIRFYSDKKILYIKNKENLGIASALNIGASNAIKDGFNWLLTLDQDSDINNSIITKMKEYLTTADCSKLGLISPYHKLKYGNIVPNGRIEKVIEVMTSGNIINLDAYEKIGGFKDWLFIDCVDIEYCLNLNLNGFDVIRLNYVKMKHNLGNMTVKHIFGKKIICSNHSAIRRYYMTRNSLYVSDLYNDKYPKYCKFLINCQKGQVKRVLFCEKNKLSKLLMIFKGYRDYKKKIVGKYKSK